MLVVGERRGLSVGDVVEARGTYSLVKLEVVGTAPLFPGQGSVRSLLVADTDTYLPSLQLDDPRYAPDGLQCPLTLQTEYWSSRPAGDVATRLLAAGVPVEEVQTAATRRLQPGFVAALLALVLLVPLTPALVDPAPRLAPGLDVALGPQLLAVVVVLGTAVLPFVVAAGAPRLRVSRSREEVVLRDDR